MISIPVKVQDKTQDNPSYVMEEYPILDPHSVVKYMWGAGLRVPMSEVQEFWDRSRQNNEPWSLFSKASSAHIPLGIYGDGATMKMNYGKQESIIGLYLNLPLWRPKSVRGSRWLLFCIEEDRLWHHFTLNRVLREIVWSCNQLYSGVHASVGAGGERLPPALEHLAGTQVCEGAVFAVVEIRGDWSWMKKIFRYYQTSWNGRNTCHGCGATGKGPYSDRYYNFEGANWDDHDFSLGEFLTKRMPPKGVCL